MSENPVAAELAARTVVPWPRILELLPAPEKRLRAICVRLGIPEIKFSRRSRGLLLEHIDALIAAHVSLHGEAATPRKGHS